MGPQDSAPVASHFAGCSKCLVRICDRNRCATYHTKASLGTDSAKNLRDLYSATWRRSSLGFQGRPRKSSECTAEFCPNRAESDGHRPLLGRVRAEFGRTRAKGSAPDLNIRMIASPSRPLPFPDGFPKEPCSGVPGALGKNWPNSGQLRPISFRVRHVFRYVVCTFDLTGISWAVPASFMCQLALWHRTGLGQFVTDFQFPGEFG